MDSLGIPGVAACIAKRGDIIWSEAFGHSNVQYRTSATRATRWRIGSVAKPLTSVALGRLVEDSRLNLDAPIQKYVPGFPKKPWPITPRQLAGHLAGIRDYRPGEFRSNEHYANLWEGLQRFAADTLIAAPGTRFAYSSYGWNLLGVALEGAARQPYLALMSRYVFKPAGMTSVLPDDPTVPTPNLATPYVHPDSTKRTEVAAPVDNSYKLPSGGLVSTASDLCRFGIALLANRLVKATTRQMLWSSQTTSAGAGTGYGLGWYVVQDRGGRFVAFHTGDAEGSSALLAIYPDAAVVLALLMNSDRDFIPQAGLLVEHFLVP